MKFEKSCGAAIFREESGCRAYLVIRSVKGHSTLCKGHVEGNETERETAMREIGEETGLCVEFVEGFREVITYAPKPDCMKDVVFFLAKAVGGRLRCQPEEVADAGFYAYSEAADRLTHAGDRQILQKAEVFLNSIR